MSKRMQFGREPDGSWSRCRAKPGNEGRYGCYHTEHQMLTQDQVAESNERIASEHGTAAAVLTKSDENLWGESISSGAVFPYDDGKDFDNVEWDKIGGDDFFNRVENHQRWSGSISRDEFLQPYDPAASDEDELEDIDHLQPAPYGEHLHDDDVAFLRVRLDRSMKDRPIERSISPSEEKALKTLLYSDNANDNDGELVREIAKNDTLVAKAADVFMASPSTPASVADSIWKRNPNGSLKTAALPSKFVDEALNDDDDHGDPMGYWGRALAQPSADPKAACARMDKLAKVYPLEKKQFEWMMTMNPSKQFHDAIAQSDKDHKYGFLSKNQKVMECQGTNNHS